MRISLKMAIIARGLGHQKLALEANRYLEPAEHLSELAISKIITERKAPTANQRAALGRVLNRAVDELFPEDSEGRDHEQV